MAGASLLWCRLTSQCCLVGFPGYGRYFAASPFSYRAYTPRYPNASANRPSVAERRFCAGIGRRVEYPPCLPSVRSVAAIWSGCLGSPRASTFPSRARQFIVANERERTDHRESCLDHCPPPSVMSSIPSSPGILFRSMKRDPETEIDAGVAEILTPHNPALLLVAGPIATPVPHRRQRGPAHHGPIGPGARPLQARVRQPRLASETVGCHRDP